MSGEKTSNEETFLCPGEVPREVAIYRNDASAMEKTDMLKIKRLVRTDARISEIEVLGETLDRKRNEEDPNMILNQTPDTEIDRLSRAQI